MSRRADFWVIAGLLSIIFLTNLPIAGTELMSPDASGYLDMGRNLFSGKGAVVSYNLYQFWPGRSHPFLPYMQPIFPVMAGLIWSLFDIKAVIGFNIGLFAVNCVLLYKLLRLRADVLTSGLVVLFMGFSPVLINTAIWPWTEQLHLFFLLSAILLYLGYKKSHFWVGAILALSCLVRVAGFYNVFAFGAAILMLQGWSKEACRDYVKIAAGFLTVLLPYEAFCFIRYGIFYPEYLAAAKTYRMAGIAAGAFYSDGFPVLNMPLVAGDTLANIRQHLAGFMTAFGIFKFVFVLAPVYVALNFLKTRTPLLIIFFLQGVCTMLFYMGSLSWLPDIETDRYSLIPFIALGSIGFLAIRAILDALFSGKAKRGAPIAFSLAALLFLSLGFRSYVPFRHFYMHTYPEMHKAYRESRDEIYAWIKENTAKDDLIASYFSADAFLLERPFVSLPSGAALTHKDLISFLDIYRPEYILTPHEEFALFLKERGFVEARRSGLLVVLRGT